MRATLYIEPNGNQRVVTVDHIPDLRRANDFHNRRQADAVEHFRSLNVSATTEITIPTREGVTARADIIIGEAGTKIEQPPGFVGETIDGSTRNYIQLDENRIAIIEIKTGNAKLTDGQKVCYTLACGKDTHDQLAGHGQRFEELKKRIIPKEVTVLRDTEKF